MELPEHALSARDVLERHWSLRRRVRAMEIRSLPYYGDILSGVDMDWALLERALDHGWLEQDGLRYRIAGDIVVFGGRLRQNSETEDDYLVATLPEAIRPQVVMRFPQILSHGTRWLTFHPDTGFVRISHVEPGDYILFGGIAYPTPAAWVGE